MIAIISDIHGNYSALQAVMTEIKLRGCTSIVSLGDVAGYYCQINECIDLLRKNNVVNVMGNHDYYLVNQQPCPRSKTANDLLGYQRQCITMENLAWLGSSPSKIEFGAMSFVHGGWNDHLEEYLTSVSREYFKNESAKYFFSGHTHIQSLKVFGDICHCNPGSAGQPRDNSPLAAFALFDGQSIHLKRVQYDIDKIAFAMERSGFSSYYYAGLYTGSKIGMKNNDIGQRRGA